MITKTKILSGIKENIVSFVVDPNMGSGTVCQIGDSWFYFGGQTAEEMSPDEYVTNIPMEDIVREVFDVLDGFRTLEDFEAEYRYYESILQELT